MLCTKEKKRDKDYDTSLFALSKKHHHRSPSLFSKIIFSIISLSCKIPGVGMTLPIFFKHKDAGKRTAQTHKPSSAHKHHHELSTHTHMNAHEERKRKREIRVKKNNTLSQCIQFKQWESKERKPSLSPRARGMC